MHAIRIVTGTLSALGALWAFLRSRGERHLREPERQRHRRFTGRRPFLKKR